MRNTVILFACLAACSLAADLKFAPGGGATMSTDDQIATFEKWAKGDPTTPKTARCWRRRTSKRHGRPPIRGTWSGPTRSSSA